MSRMKSAAAIAAIVALAVTGCGAPSKSGGGVGATNSGIKEGAQQKATDPSAKGPAKEIAGAQKGGSITVLAETTPSTFDPPHIYYTDGNQIAKLTFRTLTQFDIRNGKPVLVPDMADLGTVSADQLTWTFKLQPGMKYMDGTPVKAADYAYSIKRSFAHDVYDAGPTYQLSYFKGHDTYKGPYVAGGDAYAGVETPDENTLVIHLDKPFPDMPFYGTFPMFTPIPKAKDTKQSYDHMPMSTGPYMWKSYNPGAELKLVKNPNWDAKTDPVRHQYVDSWDFKWGGDLIKSQQQVLASQGPDATSLEYDNVDSSLVPQLADKKAQLLQGDSPCTILEQMDTRKIPLDVRKAITLAYNWDEMNKVAGNSDLTTAPASSILPPAVPGYLKFALPNLTGTGKGDPAAAKAALVKAGKLGFELSWYYSNDSTISTQVTAVRTKMFEAAGFKVHAIGVPKAQARKYTGNYAGPVNMLWSPRGWCSDWPSGSSWFPVLFKSQSVKDQNSIGELQDPALDKKIDGISALPLDQQAAKWGELDKYILETYSPALPWYYDKMAVVIGTKIGGGVGDPTQGLPIFTQLFVKS